MGLGFFLIRINKYTHHTICSFKCHVELVPVDGARKQKENNATHPGYSEEVDMVMRLEVKCTHVPKTRLKPSAEKALSKLLHGIKFSQKYFPHN